MGREKLTGFPPFLGVGSCFILAWNSLRKENIFLSFAKMACTSAWLASWVTVFNLFVCVGCGHGGVGGVGVCVRARKLAITLAWICNIFSDVLICFLASIIYILSNFF